MDYAAIQKFNSNKWIYFATIKCASFCGCGDRVGRRFFPFLDLLRSSVSISALYPHVCRADEFRVLITRLGGWHIRTRVTGGCQPTGLEAPITTYRVQCPNSKWWRPLAAVQFRSVAGATLSRENSRRSYGNQKLLRERSRTRNVRPIALSSKIRTGFDWPSRKWDKRDQQKFNEAAIPLADDDVFLDLRGNGSE